LLLPTTRRPQPSLPTITTISGDTTTTTTTAPNCGAHFSFFLYLSSPPLS
jgi:hypothetical protein